MRTKPDVRSGVRTDTGESEVRVIAYEPGNGTRYVVVLCRLPQSTLVDEALGGEPEYLVWVKNYGGAMVLECGTPVDHLDVMRALRCSVFDAVVLAELIGWATRRRAISVEEFLRSAS